MLEKGMDDQDFFTHALGIQPPWEIKEVRVDLEAQRVTVEVECVQRVWADPETQQRLHLHGSEPRSWRHLDMMQFETVIEARVPRLKYPDGHTELLPTPWAAPHSRHSFFLKHGPSRYFAPAARSKMAASCSGSNGTPLTGSWSAPWNEGWPDARSKS